MPGVCRPDARFRGLLPRLWPLDADRITSQAETGQPPREFLRRFGVRIVPPALVFLFLDPYRKNPFVRFHSIQCVLFWLVSVVLAVVVRVVFLGLLFIPIVGPLLAVLLVVVVALAAVFTWIVLLVKAFQGERFALPLIGNLSEQYSGAA
jgi:uncharacterized membrane protein